MFMGRMLKTILIIAALGAVGAVPAFITGRPLNLPLTVSFVGFTNAPNTSRPLAVFVATNTNSRTLTFATHIERKAAAGWPVHRDLGPYGDNHDIPAYKEFHFLERPPRDNEPWRVCVVYTFSDNRWGESRRRVAEFLLAHHLPVLARCLYQYPKSYSAAGPPMTVTAREAKH
jgi:hypothetical protein